MWKDTKKQEDLNKVEKLIRLTKKGLYWIIFEEEEKEEDDEEYRCTGSIKKVPLKHSTPDF